MDFFPQPTTDAILVQCDHFDGPPSDLSEQYFRSNVAWLVPMDMAENISVQQVPLRLDSYFLVVKRMLEKEIFLFFPLSYRASGNGTEGAATTSPSFILSSAWSS